MKALYNNRLCNIVDMSSDITLAEGGRQFVVSLVENLEVGISGKVLLWS